MTIWLAALYSLGIIGASAIFLAAGMHFFEWAIWNEHETVLWTAALIGVFIVFTACIYIKGGLT